MTIFLYTRFLPIVYAQESNAQIGVPEYKEDTLLIQYRQGTPPSAQSDDNPPSSTITINNTEFTELHIQHASPQALNTMMAVIESKPWVASVEREQIRRIARTPNDQELSNQWHLLGSESGGIDAKMAWDIQTGSSDIVVAVVDTGVDIDHPDLQDNIWTNTDEIADNGIDDDRNGYVDDIHGYDFVSNTPDPNPSPDGLDNDGFAGADTGVIHGTHVAGIIGAEGNNALGVSGVAWKVSVMPIQVLDDEGAGTDSDIAAGIQYAVDNGADVVHMSLGGYGSTKMLSRAVDYALEKGVIVVAAAGNDGVNINKYPFYPACYEQVIGVGSTAKNNIESSFSNRGSNCVEVSAPGESILSTVFTGKPEFGFSSAYGKLSGTSMAAPIVSGTIALMLSNDSTLTRSQVTEMLTHTADTLDLAAAFGGGRVNAASALAGVRPDDRPDSPSTIFAYKNKLKQVAYTELTRYPDSTPFFTWEVSINKDGNNDGEEGGIEGYYVYFGKDKKADPVTDGVFQKKRQYSAEQITGDTEKYYLRVVAQDTAGHTSVTPATFTYIMDNHIQQPAGVTLKKIRKGLRVSWNKVKKDHVTTYQVLRRVMKTSENQRVKKKAQATSAVTKFEVIASVPQSESRYIDEHIESGLQYQYRIKAIDDLGNSGVSEIKANALRTKLSKAKGK